MENKHQRANKSTFKVASEIEKYLVHVFKDLQMRNTSQKLRSNEVEIDILKEVNQ